MAQFIHANYDFQWAETPNFFFLSSSVWLRGQGELIAFLIKNLVMPSTTILWQRSLYKEYSYYWERAFVLCRLGSLEVCLSKMMVLLKKEPALHLHISIKIKYVSSLDFVRRQEIWDERKETVFMLVCGEELHQWTKGAGERWK